MSTTNVTLTKSWQQVAADGNEFLLTVPYASDGPIVEVATSTGAPTVTGHRLQSSVREGMSRTLLGPGDVYARAPGGDAVIVLTEWTP